MSLLNRENLNPKLIGNSIPKLESFFKVIPLSSIFHYLPSFSKNIVVMVAGGCMWLFFLFQSHFGKLNKNCDIEIEKSNQKHDGITQIDFLQGNIIKTLNI